MGNDERELYSVGEVAELLGLHVRTVRNYVREGRLKAVRIGKQYRISKEDFAALTGRPVDGTARTPHTGSARSSRRARSPRGTQRIPCASRRSTTRSEPG